MPPGTLASQEPRTSSASSLIRKLANILVVPGEVFEETVSSALTLKNWLVPTALVCVTGLVLTRVAAPKDQIAVTVAGLVSGGAVTTVQAESLSTHWQINSILLACLGAFLGTFWSAFVLWSIGRWLLKSCFSFHKTLEIVGLAATIIALGDIVTALLIVASGDSAARPALSLLVGGTGPTEVVYASLRAVNFFQVWATAVLAIGLSKLSCASFKEAAFWVFGWWLVARLGLLLLA